MRKFGSIRKKPNKEHPKYLEASFATPIDAFSKWPELPTRQVRTFGLDEGDAAAAWLGQSRKRIEAGVWEPESVREAAARSSRITLGEYWDDFITHRRTKAGESLKPQTVYRMTRDYENHIRPAFGGRRLIDITERMIDEWQDSLPREQTAMKANALKLLVAMLNAAAKKGPKGEPGLIERNPYTRGLPKWERENETVPATPQEVMEIYRAMPEVYRVAPLISVYCRGLRIGEVCALQAKHVDLKQRLLRIRQGRWYMAGERLVGSTKTKGSRRDEIIPDALIPYLEELPAMSAADPEAWLFPAKSDSSTPVHPNTMRGWYDVARAKAGRPDLRFQDLRHSALTWIAEDGATLKELMASAGHTTTAMAMHYQHVVGGRDRMLADKLGARLEQAQPKSMENERANIERQIAELQEKLKNMEP